MKVDEKKDARQRVCVNKILEGFKQPIVVNNRAIKASILEAATGFGKTRVAVLVIQDMNTRHPDRETIVVVPNLKLYEDWTRDKQVFDDKNNLILDFGHIIKHNLINIRVFVVNTYTLYKDWVTDLLVIDEIHRVANEDSEFFSTTIAITNYKWGIGLSASLSEKQKLYLKEQGWKVIDTVSVSEAERDGYISNSTVYNLAVPLSPMDEEYVNEIDTKFKQYFSKFGHEFELVRACNVGDNVKVLARLRNGANLGYKTGKEWREWYAKKMNWDGTPDHLYSPKNISKNASLTMYYMGKRKTKLQNLPSKLYYIEQLLDKFSNLKTIIFSESSEFANKVAALRPDTCLPYHTKLGTIAVKGKEVIEVANREESKILKDKGYTIKGKTVRKREILELFQDKNSKITQLSTVRAVDEGVDVPETEFILQAAYSSTTRQDTQRNGRGKRINYKNLNKVTLIVNLYIPNSQEEKWLKTKQSEDNSSVIWVTSVDEISLTKTISLYAPNIGELPANETGVISSNAE